MPPGLFIPAAFDIRRAVSDLNKIKEEAKKAGQQAAQELQKESAKATQGMESSGRQAGAAFSKGVRDGAGDDPGRLMGLGLSKSIEDVGRTTKAGSDFAKRIIKQAEEAFNLQSGDAAESLARGMIKPDEWEKAGIEAAHAFDRTILKGIERLGQTGRLTNKEFIALSGSLKNVAEKDVKNLTGNVTTLSGAFRKMVVDSIRGFKGTEDGARRNILALTGWRRALFAIIGGYLALRGIRAFSNLIRESVQLALNYEKAAGSLRELQDRTAGATEASQAFRRALGNIVLEALGGARTMDILSQAARILTEDLEASRGMAARFGRSVSTLLEVLVRLLTGIEAVSGFLVSGYTGAMSVALEANAAFARGVAGLFDAIGADGVAGKLREHVTATREEAANLRAEAQASIELARRMSALALGGEIPETRGEGATTKKLREEAEKLAKERLKIEEQLQDQLAAATMNATQLQLRELQKLVDAYVKAGGKIGGEFEKMVNGIRRTILESRELAELQESFADFSKLAPSPNVVADMRQLAEQARILRDNVDDTTKNWELADRLIRDIEERVTEIEADAIVQPFLTALEGRMADLDLLLAQGVVDEEEWKHQGELAARMFNLGLVEEIERLRREGRQELADEVTRQLEKPDTPEDRRNREMREFRRQIEGMQELSRSVIDTARNFGILNDEAAQFLDTITDIVGAAASIAKSLEGGFDFKTFDFSAVGAIVAGAGALAQRFFGESPEEKALRLAIERNVAALQRLTDQLKNTPLTGGNLAAAQTAIQNAIDRGALDDLRSTQEHGPGRRIFRAGGRAVVEEFRKQGLSFEDMKRLADELGITLFDEKGMITAEGLEALAKAVGIATDNLLAFADTADGIRERLDFEAAIFDREDSPEERARRELAIISEQAPELFQKFFAGADPTTPQGRRALEDAQRAIAKGILDETLDPSLLGELTGDELKQILRNIDDSTDAMADGLAGGEGPAGFTVRNEITTVQAAVMIGVLTTIAYDTAIIARFQPLILAALGGRSIPVTGASMATSTSQTSITIASLTVEVSGMNLPAVRDVATARQAGDGIAAGIYDGLFRRRVNHTAGEALTDYRRSRGVQP
jgi:hypothetical protein